MVLTLLVSAYKLCRYITMSEEDRLTVPGYMAHMCWWQGPGSGTLGRDVSPGSNPDVQVALNRILPELHMVISKLKQAVDSKNIRKGISEIFQLVEEAWAMPRLGREVAQELCDAIRLEGALDLLLKLLQSDEVEIKYKASQLVEQILVAENRDRIARIGLGVILNISKEREDLKLARSVSGILEHMFKHTEETCHQLISDGGLDAILYWCRWTDAVVLRHCAMALANCAMYSGPANQRLMIEKKTAEWLFPLVFSKEDEQIRFHACLAVTVLSTNKEIEKEVERAGTLELVEPFIASLDPQEFAHKLLDSSDNMQGRTAGDLQRLVPLLDSSRLEAQCIAVFYLCVEATIKSMQKKTKEHQVDGDLLLKLTDTDLREDLGMTSSITRKRFLRDLTELKSFANYSTCDRSNLADWLGSIDPKFRQYTYNLVNCGIDRNFLHRVTEQQLEEDCRVEVGFHRVRILSAAREMLHSPLPMSIGKSSAEGPDVFISYRRNTGSQLASLLKVHLQLHGFTAFIDVEKLEAGKFEDKLIQSVISARNFILVLSVGSLDKCMGDTDCKDWVHKEIATALECGKNIVPVTDHFEWPDPLSLPEDMRAVLKFNGIKWSHEYQDATIEKIIRFLQGRSSRDSSAGSENSMDGTPTLGQI
ncbi:NAD(+) hydrolase SARM1 isoform X3 [Lissotriton helveticus]